MGADDSGTDVDPEGESYESDHEWGETDVPSAVVVRTVAALSGENPLDMPPLHDVVDPDALDEVLASGRADEERSIHVSFQYFGYSIDLDRDGHLEVTRTE